MNVGGFPTTKRRNGLSAADCRRLLQGRSSILRLLALLVTAELLVWSFFSTRKVLFAEPPSTLDLLKPFYSKQPSHYLKRGNSTNDVIRYASPQVLKEKFYSSVHCVGDNWEPTSILFRSCHFHNLCWSRTRQEFILLSSPTQYELDQHVVQAWKHPFARISTVMQSNKSQASTVPTVQVLPMGQRPGFENRAWFPTIIDDKYEQETFFSNGYWQLNDDIVLIPLYLPTKMLGSLPMSKNNRRTETPTRRHLSHPNPSYWSLLTETLFPMYTLLSMFQMDGFDRKTTVFVQFLPQPRQEESCIHNISSTCFSKEIVPPNYSWWQTTLHSIMSWHVLEEDYLLWSNTSVNTKVDHGGEHGPALICAKNGVAGMGCLTDHGLHQGHGERGNDYRIPPQVGRGPQWWDFRNYILRHQPAKWMKRGEGKRTKQFQAILAFPPYLPLRDHIFRSIHQHFDQYNNLQVSERQDRHGTKTTMTTSLVSLHNTSRSKNIDAKHMTECIRVASKSRIFIATADDFDRDDDTDDAESLFWPALFLPRGATLILYYDDTKKVPIARGASRPRMMYFNIWNNLSYLQVHWLPMPKQDIKKDLGVLISLVDMELQRFKASVQAKLEVSHRPPDAKLNGVDLHLKKGLPASSKLHCLGDNFHPWFGYIYQSCQIHNLCLDLHQPNNGTFFIAPTDHRQQQLATQLMQWNTPDASVSTDALVYHKRVTVGHSARFSKGNDWFPEVRVWPKSTTRLSSANDTNTNFYYELPSNLVWLIFYAEQPNINNPGHLLWDYFLAMHTLLAMFDLDKQHQLFLTNLDQQCSVDSQTPCYNSTSKFLPLLGVAPMSFRSVHNMLLETNKSKLRSHIVCASQAVLGMGMLTDHGLKRHGQGVKDYRHVHNAGRGAQLYKFRNHLLKHMGLLRHQRNKPFLALFSMNSSFNPSRRRDFAKQIALIQSSFPTELSLQKQVIALLPLREQLQLMEETSIFVSVVGGATSTATFLSPGACLILYFNDLDDFVSRAGEDRPNMMDWDFWNNASYLRVHWLPIKSMDSDMDLESLRLLFQHEIFILRRKYE